MSNVKLNSKNNSAATFVAQRQTLPLTKSEHSYLADQAADAKSAMVRTLHDMKNTLINIADIRSYVKRHPWLVAGSAVVAGFVAGTKLTSYARTKTKHTGSNSEALLQPGGEGQKTLQSKKSVLLSIVGTTLASILQTAVQDSIAAAAGKPRARRKLKRRHRHVAHKRPGTIARVEDGDL